MQIEQKGKIAQLFCKHEFVKGVLHEPGKPIFFNLSGDEITVVCKKCGKIKDRYFLPNRDGS